jgi:hypothetical protein
MGRALLADPWGSAPAKRARSPFNSMRIAPVATADHGGFNPGTSD